jgi:SAM-dependent methyltransferase
MNFNTCEINNWYTTKAGEINSKLIISAINKIPKPSFEKNILYIGSEVIIKELMNQNYNFNSFYISDSQNADIIAETKKLPFQDSSIDCVILIHAIEADSNHHAAFREVNRVLCDDGEIILASFNRVSFLGLYGLLPISSIFKKKQYISISRILDWMSLFSYNVSSITNLNKIPPVRNKKILKTLSFLNNNILSKINYFGNSYVIYAKKNTYKFIAIKNWHKKNNIILGKFSKPAVNNNYEK